MENLSKFILSHQAWKRKYKFISIHVVSWDVSVHLFIYICCQINRIINYIKYNKRHLYILTILMVLLILYNFVKNTIKHNHFKNVLCLCQLHVLSVWCQLRVNFMTEKADIYMANK